MTAHDHDLLLESLDDFSTRHGTVVTTALRAYAEDMRKNAAALRAGYDKIKDDPAARAWQDKAIVTTEGLRMLAELNAESADRADRACEAFISLTEGDDEEDGR